jgi:ABC-type transport system involved in cytochrome c biogenesis permease component
MPNEWDKVRAIAISLLHTQHSAVIYDISLHYVLVPVLALVPVPVPVLLNVNVNVNATVPAPEAHEP